MAELENKEFSNEWYSTSSNDKETAVYMGETTDNRATVDGEISSTSDEARQPQSDGSSFDTLKAQIGQEMAGQLWRAGKNSTEKLISTYGHIDILRPYFDVEPVEVRDRLIRTFIPNIRVSAPQDISSELYGPLMLVFTLVAILLYGMKTSGHVVKDGTLIGTALGACVSYWVGLSSILSLVSYLVTAHFTFLQVLSLVGYSLTAHCTILLFSAVFDHYGSPGVFYILWMVVGGVTACKVTCIFISRSWSRRDGLILSGVYSSFHLLSILYLRFMYHKIYEAVAEVI